MEPSFWAVMFKLFIVDSSSIDTKEITYGVIHYVLT